MRVATEQETQEFLNQSSDWLKEALGNVGMFWDFQDTVKIAVAEYIANQQGLSLWEHNKRIEK